MTIKLPFYVAAAALVTNAAFAACEGPDTGGASTVVTVPANESVDIFHRRTSPRATVVEFCVRDPGREWVLVASHGAERDAWSLLQPWIYPKTMQLKTTVYGDGDLNPLESRSRQRTKFGYSFSWFAGGIEAPSDEIVYCYRTGTGCPASRRTDFR